MRKPSAAQRSIILGLLIMFAVVATLSGSDRAAALPPNNTAQVSTTDGALRGIAGTDTRVFRGIPYAAPPVGGLRFRPPQPALPWSGVRDATQAGPECAQPFALGASSEDCLTLNVETPVDVRSRNLPVMVWFFGGGFFAGAASGYDPTPLVTQGNVVVVTVNYRLGPFGFLALPGLDAESHTAGNDGILDQQAALRWIRANIGAFNGDPGNVTIFGESAGGHSVCMQMISPSAAGLFHKAISESGGCIDTPIGPTPKADAFVNGRAFAAKAGCPDPTTQTACLRGKSTQDLVNATGIISATGLAWSPTIDGTVIPDSPAHAMASGHYNHVPIMVGTNLTEARLFTTLVWNVGSLRPTNATDLAAIIRTMAGDHHRTDFAAIAAAYPPTSPTNADAAVADVLTHSIFSCPALAVSEALSSHPGQVLYQYEFADPNPPGSALNPTMPMGDFHGSELTYLFSQAQGLPSPPLFGAQKNLSNQMIDYWTTFARTGNPNSARTPMWPAFGPNSARVEELSSAGPAPTTEFSAGHHCRLWGQS